MQFSEGAKTLCQKYKYKLQLLSDSQITQELN
jgi:hypothetical protein